MLSEILLELQKLLWGLGITASTILILWLMPEKYSQMLGEHPVILSVLFIVIVYFLIVIFKGD